MSQESKPRCERGVTLVELFVVTIVIVLLSTAIGGMAVRSTDAQKYAAKQSKVTNLAQDMVEGIRVEVSSSMRLFQNDSEGLDYLSRLDRTNLPGLSSETLPTIASDGVFEKDSSLAPKTGNVILFALHDRTDTFDVNEGLGEVENVRTDIYRIVAFYLKKQPDEADDKHALELVRWVSAPLADWSQVSRLLDSTQREALLNHLYAGSNVVNPDLPYPPVRLVWRPGLPTEQALGTITELAQIEAFGAEERIPVDERRTRASLLERLRVSIATNAAGNARGVARFGIKSNLGDGFPHGFETQIIGPASARQVLIHMTLVSRGKLRHRAWLELTSVAETRDL